MKRTNSLSDKMLKPESLCLKCCNTYDVYKNMKNDKDIKEEKYSHLSAFTKFMS